MSNHRSSRILLRSVLVGAWLLAAVFVAVVLIPAPWEGTGGRDFRPQGVSLSVLLLASGVVVRYGLRWPWLPIFLGLLAVELLALLTIGYFSGSSGAELLSAFNLRWFAFINLFIAAPWLAGAGIGEAVWRFKVRAGGD